MLQITTDAAGVTFAVRVSPRASRSEIAGEHDGALKVRLAAPPVDGEANDELCAVLSKKLGVPKRAVRIVQGETSKSKLVHVTGTTADAVRALLG
jgi:uncharacterized protein (TIGR00251 family)